MHTYTTIRTNDGTEICLDRYSPQSASEKVIIIAPGLGFTQDHYDQFARFLCEHGYMVITFDYRGAGNSGPQNLNGFAASLHQWAVQDMNAVVLYVKQHYPMQEIIFMGHGVGGEIIGLAPASQYINKIVLISSALSCARLFPLRDKVRIAGLRVLSKATGRLLRYFPGRKLNVYDDLPAGVMHEWIHWFENSNGLFDIYPDNNYRKLTVPVLAFSFSGDWHCPPRAVKELLSRLPNAIINWYHLKPGQLGMNKIVDDDFFRAGMRNIIWQTLLRWMNHDNSLSTAEKNFVIRRTLTH